MRLQAILVSRATHGTNHDEEEFQRLREQLISEKELQNYIPDFLFTCRNLDQFWDYVKKPTFSHYDERRLFLKNEFDPLLAALEEKHSLKIKENLFEYDIAFSFAGEDREIVKQIAEQLKTLSISVFYDEYEKAKLWGKRLDHYFKSTYAESTKYVIPFISKHYPNKDWANFEFTIANAESKKRDSEFILPVRIDDTVMVGISDNVAYLDYNAEGKDGIIKAIQSKLGK